MIAPVEITGTVVGVEQVLTHFRARTDRARAIVRAHVERATISLQNRVRFSFLSGQSLRKRTGRLINSINERISETSDAITGSVGTKVPYGRFWELGFQGVEHVREHVRRISSRSVFSRGGSQYDPDRHGGVYRVKIAQGIAFVRAHDRTVNQSARPFLRPALLAERLNIQREMAAAVREITQ